MQSIEKLEKRISEIEKRNARVETDKAWETSWTRKVLLAFFTYTSIALYFYVISVPSPLLNAVVPTVGFLLSTLTLPYFRRIWERKFNTTH